MTYSKLPVLEDIEAIDCLDSPDTTEQTNAANNGQPAKKAWTPDNKMTFSNLPLFAGTSHVASPATSLEPSTSGSKELGSIDAESKVVEKSDNQTEDNSEVNLARRSSSRAKWRERQMGTFSKVPITPIDEGSSSKEVKKSEEKLEDDNGDPSSKSNSSKNQGWQ